MKYIFLVLTIVCLIFFGGQLSAAMKIMTHENASTAYIIAFLSPVLLPTLVFGGITIWLFKNK